MAEEGDLGVSDIVMAELVECAPPPDIPRDTIDLPDQPDQTPVQRAAEATIAQTGADPPPMVTCG
jgi:hypothetical protein